MANTDRKEVCRLLELPPGIPILTGSYGIRHHLKGEKLMPAYLRHNDFDLWFVAKGEATWEIRNGERFTLRKDHFFLLPPFLQVIRHPVKSDVTLWFCHFNFQDIPTRSFLSVRKDCLELGRKVFIPWTFSKKEAPEVWRAYRDFLAIDLTPTGEPKKDSMGRTWEDWGGTPWKKSRALLHLVSEVANFALRRNFSENKNEVAQLKAVANPRLMDLLNRIYLNPGHPWNREEMAASIGITVRHLNHLCYSSLGISIKKHIDEVRLQYAAKLLAKEPWSIKEVSHACGFSFSQHFSHYFKKHTGMTPLEFRSQPNRI